jgi:hypothetical protein
MLVKEALYRIYLRFYLKDEDILLRSENDYDIDVRRGIENSLKGLVLLSLILRNFLCPRVLKKYLKTVKATQCGWRELYNEFIFSD